MNKSILLQNNCTVTINKDITVSYEVISEKNLFDGYGEVEEFGIKLIQNKNGVKSELEIRAISISREVVDILFDKFKRGLVTIISAQDIVEDFIISNYI